MKEKFLELGFSEKEYSIYLYLVEFWESPASEISKYIWIPKSTINFIADKMWTWWILKKSFRWNTGYFEFDIDYLEQATLWQYEKKKKVFNELIPLLKEKSLQKIDRPKVIFIDWVENCKKAYLELLKVDIFYEIWAHEDLVIAFWEKFMNDFINARVKSKVFCDSIWISWLIERELKLKDKEQYRDLEIFSSDFWEINSSIAIYENKVLILNLKDKNYSWILVENKNLSNTLKTVYNICKKQKN